MFLDSRIYIQFFKKDPFFFFFFFWIIKKSSKFLQRNLSFKYQNLIPPFFESTFKIFISFFFKYYCKALHRDQNLIKSMAQTNKFKKLKKKSIFFKDFSK